MSDISLTAANVTAPIVSQMPNLALATVAIAAGAAIVVSGSGPAATAALAKNDTTADAAVNGIAIASAAIGQWVPWMSSGVVLVGTGTGLVVGASYYASANAGGICPEADLGTGKIVTLIGVGVISGSTPAIQFPPGGPIQTGVTHA